MPHTTQARSRAPYLVYAGEHFLFLAADLQQLHGFLLEREAAAAIQEKQALERRIRVVDRGAPWYDLPAVPMVSVFDNRRDRRPDLASAGSIRHHFSPRGRIAAHFVDRPWDGDIRPRGAPIPGTGRRVRYGRMYYRYPRTQRERRMGYSLIDEGEPGVRVARSAHVIPNAWDGLPRRGHEDRSWKRFRCKQWAVR